MPSFSSFSSCRRQSTCPSVHADDVRCHTPLSPTGLPRRAGLMQTDCASPAMRLCMWNDRGVRTGWRASSVSPRSRSTRADFIQMRSLASVARALARIPRARSISAFSNSILKAASQICSLSAPAQPPSTDHQGASDKSTALLQVASTICSAFSLLPMTRAHLHMKRCRQDQPASPLKALSKPEDYRLLSMSHAPADCRAKRAGECCAIR